MEWLKQAADGIAGAAMYPYSPIEAACLALSVLSFALAVTLIVLYVRKRRITRARDELASALTELLGRALGSFPEILNIQNPPSAAADIVALEQAVDLLDRNRASTAAQYLRLANAAFANGDHTRALGLSERALERSEQTRDSVSKSIALGNLGALHRERKDSEASFKHLSYALTVAREIGHKPSEASHLRNIGLLYKAKGDSDMDPEMALDYFQNALAIDSELGNRESEAQNLDHIGVMHLDRGDLDLAFTYLQDALAIHREIENRRGEAKTLANFAIVHQLKGDHDAALRLLKTALEIHEDTINRRGEAQVLANIGLVHQARGDFDLALEYHTDALLIDREIGDKGGEAMDLGSIGMIYYRKGNVRTALKHLREARDLLAVTGPASDLETVEGTIKELEAETPE